MRRFSHPDVGLQGGYIVEVVCPVVQVNPRAAAWQLPQGLLAVKADVSLHNRAKRHTRDLHNNIICCHACFRLLSHSLKNYKAGQCFSG